MDMKSMVDGQLRSSRNITLEGKIIDHNFGDVIVFFPCLCVQDTPENPCPCKDFRLLIDLRDLEQKPRKTKQTSDDGEDIYSIEVNRNANVVVESSRGMPIQEAAELNIGISPAITGALAGRVGISALMKQILELLDRLKTDRPEDSPFPDDATTAILPILGLIIAAEIGVIGGLLAAKVGNRKTCTTDTTTRTLPNGDTVTTSREVCR